MTENTYRLMQSSFLINVLDKEHILCKGLEVQIFGHSERMIVQGFIPISLTEGMKNLFIDLSAYIIGINVVRFKTLIETNNYGKKSLTETFKTFRIYDQIQSAAEEYKIEKDTIFLEYSYSSNMNYLYDEPGNIPQQKKEFILKTFPKIKEHVDYFVYETEAEFEFSSIFSNSPKVVGKEFLCLCSYLNCITGKIEYQLFNPNDLIVLLPHEPADEK